MHEHLVLVSFRPTPRQALGRGLYVGAWCAACCAAVVGPALLFGPLGGAWPLVFVLVPLVLGGAVGLVCCRRPGTEAAEAGVRPLAGCDPPVQPWPGIADLRAERHGGRIEVRAYLDDGACIRLPAPYDGRLLAHDPGFELKYLTLRQVWEAHRSWNPSSL